MLAEHPVRRELGERAWRPWVGDRPGWMADYLAIAPTGQVGRRPPAGDALVATGGT